MSEALDRFVAVLAAAQELYPREPAMTPERAELYRLALVDYAPEALQAALIAHSRDPERGRFFPLPADFIAQIEVSGAQVVASAWSQARQYLWGPLREEDLVPQVRQAVAHMGGKARFRMTLESETRYIERQFREVFQAVSGRDRIGPGVVRAKLDTDAPRDE